MGKMKYVGGVLGVLGGYVHEAYVSAECIFWRLH